MASQATLPKVATWAPKKRIEDQDLRDLSLCVMDQIENHLWSALVGDNCVAYGFAVESDGGTAVSISRGVAIQQGQLLKTSEATRRPLAIGGNLHPRIDAVFLNGFCVADTDPRSVRCLGSVVFTQATGVSLGAGDGVTKAFNLPHDLVDLRTIKVLSGADQIGGWNFSEGTGTEGKDQLLFDPAPPAGALTADYTYMSGGVEANYNNAPSRKTRVPALFIEQGTPAASPSAPSVPSGAIPLAQITVPAGWPGTGALTIDNSVKTFLLGVDSENLEGSPLTTPSGQLANALRGADQVVTGCRLRYVSSTTVAVTPGWGVYRGVSWSVPTETQVTVSTGSAGWRYLYLDVSLPAGSTPSLSIETTAPNALRRVGSPATKVYLGAFYVISTGPYVVRPFITRGAWTLYPAAISGDTGLNYDVSAGGDIDISAGIPATGRLFDAAIYLNAQAPNAGDKLICSVQSKQSTSTYPSAALGVFHSLNARIQPAQTADVEENYIYGMLQAEDVSGVRTVNAVVTETTASGTFTISSGTPRLTIRGYLDDYRSMDASGSALNH